MDGVNITNGDCDNSDELNFPGNPEVYDGQDNDCDNLVDTDDPESLIIVSYRLLKTTVPIGMCQQKAVRLSSGRLRQTPDSLRQQKRIAITFPIEQFQL